MLKFSLRRLLEIIPVLFVVVTVTFFLIRVAPGGPFSDERNVSPEILAHLNAHYGLDQPLYRQYAAYLGNVLRGDLGPSFKYHNRTVNELIADALPVSLQLGFYALIVALTLGILAGATAALRPNTRSDYLPMALAMTGICLPTFVLGPILILVFGLWLGWFPVSGWFTPLDRVLPSFTLGFFYAAYIARLTRGSMLEVLAQDYIRTARAKGLTESMVVLKHGLRTGLLPVVSFLGPAIAGLISGSFVIETIFQIPGLGRHFVNAAFNRDYTMVLGTVLFYAGLIVVLNFIVDVVQAWLNPKMKLQ